MPHEAGDFLVLAGHHDHLVDQSGSKHKRYHHRERAFWLACAAGRLGETFDTLKALVFDTLDAIVRASSLVEMVNALLRPSLHSCKGQIPQAALHLIMLYHTHRRDKSGKRQGKAPLELLTGEALEAQWWELFLPQVNREEAAPDTGTRPSRPVLQLLVNNEWRTARQAMAPSPPLVEPTGASEKNRRQTDADAA
jgi:hypothetical protein